MSRFWNYLIRRVVTPFMEIKDLEKETSCVAVASDMLSVRWSWKDALENSPRHGDGDRVDPGTRVSAVK